MESYNSKINLNMMPMKKVFPIYNNSDQSMILIAQEWQLQNDTNNVVIVL